jgi:hypothetical protein
MSKQSALSVVKQDVLPPSAEKKTAGRYFVVGMIDHLGEWKGSNTEVREMFDAEEDALRFSIDLKSEYPTRHFYVVKVIAEPKVVEEPITIERH